MLQHLLRRLVFDVPILNEFAKMPLKVNHCRVTILGKVLANALPEQANIQCLAIVNLEFFSITI